MEHKEKDEILLRLENLKTVISSKDGKLVPVDGVDIEIPKGKTVGVVGESGCGKSMTAMSISSVPFAAAAKMPFSPRYTSSTSLG